MYELRTDIEINASPQRVWSILVDFRAHSDWNPSIRKMEGAARVGERLTVSIKPRGGRGMNFRPTLLTVLPNQELRWLGRFLFPRVFDGEHYFQIRSLAPDRTKFMHGEKFSGILVPFAKSSVDSGTKAGFTAMNEALKTCRE